MTETLLAARRFHFVPVPLHYYRKKRIPSGAATGHGGRRNLRRHKVVESSILQHARALEISARETLQPLTRKLIRREFVNRGSHIVRQIHDISDPVQKAHYLRRVREEKVFGVLWRNAAGVSQYWRVFRYQLFGYVLAPRGAPEPACAGALQQA